MTDDSNVRRIRPPIPWEKLVADHIDRTRMSEEQAVAIWDKIRESHPLVDYIVLGKPIHETLPHVMGHLQRMEKSHNAAFRLAPMQRLWQLGRKIARRFGARWAR